MAHAETVQAVAADFVVKMLLKPPEMKFNKEKKRG